jgi:hypothetical protein
MISRSSSALLLSQPLTPLSALNLLLSGDDLKVLLLPTPLSALLLCQPLTYYSLSP